MEAYTKGPWRVEEDIRSEYDRGHSDYRDYLAGYNIISDEGEIVGIEGIIPGGNAEANARLIAAAPELLEAAERAIVSMESREKQIGVISPSATALRAAIAKARGEA